MIMPVPDRRSASDASADSEPSRPDPIEAARRGLERQVSSNPVVTLAVAAAAGVLLGCLVKR